MQKTYSDSGIPSFARQDAYDFGGPDGARGRGAESSLYLELSQIAEEIEVCRRRNY